MNLQTVVGDYMALAKKGAVIDYTFHLIIADPTDVTLKEHVPALVAQGHSTLKVFMTYDLLNVGDEKLLDILLAARQSKALVCVHAENHGMVSWMGKRLVEKGYPAPKFHTISHPQGLRGRGLQPADHVRGADRPADHDLPRLDGRGRGHHTGCARPRPEGVRGDLPAVPLHDGQGRRTNPASRAPSGCARRRRAPKPTRRRSGRDWRWATCRSSRPDHAPYAFDATGKLMAGPNPTFKQIANGMPGIEARLPVLFDAMVSKGRLGLQKFVEVTATAPAKIYNLHPRKGSIAIGADADIVMWDPKRQVTLADNLMHDGARYTPYAGRTITGWPATVMRRGEVIVREGKLTAKPGSGAWLPRTGGPAAAPLQRLTADMDPARNFGAKLL